MGGEQEVRVVLVEGEASSGLAQMTHQYLEQTLAEVPAKRGEALGLRGRLGLQADEGGVAVTLSFEGEEIRIQDGLLVPLDAYIAGPFQLLLDVLGGRASPYREVLRGRLRVRPSLRRPLFGLRAYRFMRLAEAGGGGLAGRLRAWSIMGVGGILAGLLLLVMLKGRRRGE